MRVKKGDILVSEEGEYSEIVCMTRGTKQLIEGQADHEVLFGSYVDESFKFANSKTKPLGWISIGIKFFDDLLVNAHNLDSYIKIGNYFKLKNKRKMIKGLMSPDADTRKFFIEVIKNQS